MKLVCSLFVLCFYVASHTESRRVAKAPDPLKRIVYRMLHPRPSKPIIMTQNEEVLGDARNSGAENDVMDKKQIANHYVEKRDNEKLYEPDLNKFPFEIGDKTVNKNPSISEEEAETEKEIEKDSTKSNGFSQSNSLLNQKETNHHESTRYRIKNSSNKLITMSQLVTEVAKTIFRMGSLVNPLRGSIADYFNTIRRSYQNGKFKFSSDMMKKTGSLIEKIRKVFTMNKNVPIHISGVDKNNFQFLISKWKNGIIRLRAVNLANLNRKETDHNTKKNSEENQFNPHVLANDDMAENRQDRKMPVDKDKIENPNPVAERNISDISNSFSKNEKLVDHQGKVIENKEDRTDSSIVKPSAAIKEKNVSDEQTTLTWSKLVFTVTFFFFFFLCQC